MVDDAEQSVFSGVWKVSTWWAKTTFLRRISSEDVGASPRGTMLSVRVSQPQSVHVKPRCIPIFHRGDRVWSFPASHQWDRDWKDKVRGKQFQVAVQGPNAKTRAGGDALPPGKSEAKHCPWDLTNTKEHSPLCHKHRSNTKSWMLLR